MAILQVATWQEAVEQALDELGLQWLNDTHPQLAEAIALAMGSGATPGAVRRLVMERTGRVELAARCEQAARAVARTGDG